MTLETLVAAVPGLKDRDRDEVGGLSVLKCSQIHLLRGRTDCLWRLL